MTGSKVLDYCGVRVCVIEDIPRYTLPKMLDLPSGVSIPWPPGFRDEINSWSRSFLGGSSLVADGQVMYADTGRTAYVNLRTWAHLRNATREETYGTLV